VVTRKAGGIGLTPIDGLPVILAYPGNYNTGFANTARQVRISVMVHQR
jgi:hypothetical protein